MRIIKDNYPEIITKTIPGISSISAAAALNDFDLVIKGETLIIKECPSLESELKTLIRESKANKTVLAIMKVGKRWNLVREILKKEDVINTSLIALSGFDLVKKGETLIIKECPSSKAELTSLIRESKGNKTVLAIMKVGKRWNLVREILQKEDIINTSLIALTVGMPDQIIQIASQYKKDFMPYFSLILMRFD